MCRHLCTLKHLGGASGAAAVGASAACVQLSGDALAAEGVPAVRDHGVAEQLPADHAPQIGRWGRLEKHHRHLRHTFITLVIKFKRNIRIALHIL
jgi:hypothetical protein